MLIQLDELFSLIHSTAARALAWGRKGQEGAFLVNLNTHPVLASGSSSTSLISEVPSAYGIAPHHQLISGLFLSQSGWQSDPVNSGTDKNKGTVQRQELPKAVLLQEKKMKLYP